MMKLRVYISIFFLSTMALLQAKEEVMQPIFGDSYNIVWNSQSANSSESMPCGGGDVGMNVWVEEGDLLVYFSRSGTFDENNTMLKLGRLRIQMDKPLDKEDFMQVLRLPQGDVLIQSGRGDDYVEILLWADVFKPVIHIEVDAVKAHKLKASYESWRHEDRTLRKNESFGNSYKWAPPKGLQIKADYRHHGGHFTGTLQHFFFGKSIQTAGAQQYGVKAQLFGNMSLTNSLLSRTAYAADFYDHLAGFCFVTADFIYNGGDDGFK